MKIQRLFGCGIGLSGSELIILWGRIFALISIKIMSCKTNENSAMQVDT